MNRRQFFKGLAAVGCAVVAPMRPDNPGNPHLHLKLYEAELVLAPFDAAAHDAMVAMERHQEALTAAEGALRDFQGGLAYVHAGELLTTLPPVSQAALVPPPMDGEQWYLGTVKGANAGRCVECFKELDHPYYTGGPVVGKAHLPSDPHPPILFPSQNYVPRGLGVPWAGQLDGPDGFAYVTPTGVIWTGDLI